MNSIDYLNKNIEVKIDRPIGSSHPDYPDCYVLGEYKPLKEYRGKCIAIIHRLNDDDDKLIIVPENKTFTNSEIRLLTDFQEKFYESEIIRSSNYLEFNKNIPELSVTNLENSLNFYKTAGFKVEYDRLESKFAFISLDKIQFMLQEIADNDKWDIAPLSYPFGNGINFQLEVENLDKIYNNFKNSDYKITFNMEENWYRQNNKLLGSKEFLIQDPDGYLLRFSEDLGEKEV